MGLTMDEFAELERDFSSIIMTPSKSTEPSSSKKKAVNTNEVQNLFQNIIANTSLSGVEKLDSQKITWGGRNMELILPAIFGGVIFLAVVIFFDVMVFLAWNQHIIFMMVFALILIPFNLFAIACLGLGLGEIIHPSNTLQEVLVQTWYDRSKRLILVIRYIYDVEDEELHDAELMTYCYVTDKHYIRIFSEKPYSGELEGAGRPRRPGGRRVCICTDGNKQSFVSVLTSFSFSHKTSAKQSAKYYSEELGIPFLGILETKSLPKSPLDWVKLEN